MAFGFCLLTIINCKSPLLVHKHQSQLSFPGISRQVHFRVSHPYPNPTFRYMPSRCFSILISATVYADTPGDFETNIPKAITRYGMIIQLLKILLGGGR
jgi:hypothetical protein